MDPQLVTVIAPSRLHFGLLSVGAAGRQFGGAGVMIEPPSTVIEITRWPRFAVSGPLASRVQATAETWQNYHHREQLPPCQIKIRRLAPQHVGLGSGTQLGLSIVAGLNHFSGRPSDDAVALTSAAGRGRRSAVGTYGFLHGGLIVERGRYRHEPLGPLQTRLPLPDAWRFVLARPLQQTGLSGSVEMQAFRDLPAPPTSLRAALSAELQRNLVPAARCGNFKAFGRSVYRYGRLAGLYFVKMQGGPYNGTRIAALVDEIRRTGVEGVGQSSWGPTVFALTETPDLARKLVQQLRDRHPVRELELAVCRVNNTGARVDVQLS